MTLINLFKLRSSVFGANPIKKLLFFGALLFFGVNGFGQNPTVSIERISDGSENGPQPGQFRVSVGVLETLLGNSVEVFYGIGETSTATSGSDFETIIGSVTVNYTLLGGFADVNIEVIDDDIIEGNESIIIELLPDPDYILGSQITATITIQDNDASVAFSSASDSSPEDAGTNLPTLFVTGTVVSTSTVTVTDLDTGTAVNEVDYTFTSPQEVIIPAGTYDGTSATAILIPTLTIISDDIVELDETIDLELGAFTGDIVEIGNPSAITFTILNDDIAGFALSTNTLTTVENGDPENFTVVLTAAPISDVVLNLVSSNESEGTVSPSTLTFTPATWDSAQTVTVTPVDDDIVDGAQTYDITVSVDEASSDDNFDAVPAQVVSVTNNDDETAGFALSTNTLTTVESGDPENFTVVLTAAPSGNVVLNVVSGDPTEGTVSPSTLTFTPATWDSAQTVTVTPVDDGIADGSQTYDITVSVDDVLSDVNFALVPDQLINVTNDDDDIAGFTLSPITLTTIENGDPENFTVVLTTAPSGNVVLNVVSGDPTEGIVSPSTLTFTPANWNTPRIVEVTPVDDGIVDGPQTYTVTVSIDPANSDNNFDLVPAQQVNVTNNDDDSYTATITATTPTASEASLVPGVFTVSLDAVNTTGNPIVVNYIVDGDATLGLDYTLAPSAGTVSIANEESSATITVTPINDNEVEEDETVILTLATGSGYDIGTPDNATISIISEDRANISIDDVTVNEGEGMATFIVTLNGDTPTDFTVSYITINGTALAGSDYIANNGSLDFEGNDGESYPIEIEILDDGLPESNETFFVELTVSNGFVELLEERVMGTIVDNDNCVAQPIRDPNVPIVFCEENFSQDLNAYVAASDIPAGYQLIWSYEDDFTVTEARLTNTVVTGAATYFGFLYNDQTNCTSTPLAVTLTQNDPPSIISTTPATICGPGTATLSATGSVSGGALYWYASPTSNDRLWVGPNFTTPNNTVTTIYYVETLANGCTSARIPVTVTVSDPIEIGTTVNDTACNEVGGNTTIDLDSTRIGNDLATGVWSIVGPQPGTVTIGPDNIVDFEGAAEGQYIFRFTTNTAVAPCVDESVEVTISVSDCTVDIIDLGLEKTVDKTNVLEGEEVVFTLTLTNLGQTTFTNVIVDELIDPDLGFQYVSHSASKGAYDVDEGLWELEEVLGDEVITLSITASVVGQGTFQNVATLMDSFPEDQNPANNTDSASVTVGSGPIADLGLEKAVDKDNVLEGDQVVFTVTLTNLGPMPVTNISVNELIDPNIGFQYVSHTASNGNYDVVRGVWELEEVLAEAINTLTITAMVVRQGTFQNVVSLANSFPADENPANNTARVSVTVGPRSNDECGFLFNQISPNGDGINDALYINCIDQFPNNSIQIFDRYGNEVFVARRYDNSWMGTGKNGDLPKGTYFYILDLGDGTEVKKGWIQIIR